MTAPPISMFQLDIVPLGNLDRTVVEFLSHSLRESLRIKCLIRNAPADLSGAYHPTRQQYNSTQILAQLAKIDCSDKTKILGVTEVDLFIPILTFVFGEAQLGQRAALISVHRLRQSFYGLPEDPGLFYERCEKEAIHELGHLFGLVHCHNFECVMHFSNSVEQVDLKATAFCGACDAFLRDQKDKHV